MNNDETRLRVATGYTRPRSVEITSPQPEAVIADLTDPTPLEIALGVTEPLPWPASIAEEIALAESRFRGPVQTRKASEVARVLSLLDILGKEGTA